MVAAAGQGRRFGSQKLLAEWQGRPVLAHVLATLVHARAAGVIENALVVHQEGDDGVAALVAESRCLSQVAPARPAGLGISVRLGLRRLAASTLEPRAEAVVICLGDQPLLRLPVIVALVSRWRQSPAWVIRPSYREQPDVPGHPLVLDRRYWSLGEELSGDFGLTTLLGRHRVPVETVSVGGSNPGIDTPEDLARLPEPADETEL